MNMNDQELRIKCLEMALSQYSIRDNEDRIFLQAQRIYEFVTKNGERSPAPQQGEQALHNTDL